MKKVTLAILVLLSIGTSAIADQTVVYRSPIAPHGPVYQP